MSVTPWASYVEVCATGSISRAAAHLGYTQSAVSRQVAGLEREVGTTLLRRGPRGVEPTPEGAALLRHAQTIVNEAARARLAVARASVESSPAVVVGAIPSAMAGLVPQALSRRPDRGPSPGWVLRSGLTPDLEERVVSGELDVAVVSDYAPGLAPEPRLRRTEVLTDEMAVILPADHPLAQGSRRLPMARLSEEVWVEDNAGSAALLVQAAVAAGFSPRIDHEVGDLVGKMAMVAAGYGIALVPLLLRPALRPDVGLRRLVQAPRRRVYVVTSVERGSTPGVEDAVTALRAAASEV